MKGKNREKAKIELDFNDVKLQLQFIAWRDFLLWAITDVEIIQLFERNTGHKLLRPVIEDIIVEGKNIPYKGYSDFIIWVTRELWGETYAPKKYFDMRQAAVTANRRKRLPPV